MQLTEQIQLKPTPEMSHLCHLAKNLYNEANFEFRQLFFNLGEFVNYYDLQVMLKDAESYKQLPAQTSQQVIDLVVKNWKVYFAALREYKTHPEKFRGCPRSPKYKGKDGESIVIFTNQNTRIKDGYVHFPKKAGLPPLKTRLLAYQQIRIIPQGIGYTCEIIYNCPETDLHLNPGNVIGIDLGLNNLATIVNNIGLSPIVIKGGMVKSMNQFYNKINAYLQSWKTLQGYEFQTQNQQKLLRKRNNKIRDIFHKVSRKVVDYCIQNDIGTIVIGYNEGWKQEVNLGGKNNQNFAQVPFAKFVAMIEYKARMVGIHTIRQEESYTSKCSFLDNEPIEKHKIYCGKRIRRGLFYAKTRDVINADANGAYNIVKKAVPNAFAEGIEGVALHPTSLAIEPSFARRIAQIY